MAERKLSRGLEYLLGRSGAPLPAGGGTPLVEEVPVDSIALNPAQPRRAFDEDELVALRRSIEQDGLLQPLVVRRTEDGFQLVAGERRLRAVRALGWKTVPALVRETSDDENLVLALAENLLRQDLDPIEEALAFKVLHENVGLTHEQIGARVGRSRAAVTNALRLLDLPDWVQQLVSRGTLSAGHARALVGLEDDRALSELVRRIVGEQWSVRQTEEFLRRPRRAASDRPVGRGSPAAYRDSRTASAAESLERRLREAWGVSVKVLPRSRGGAIRFDCASREEFEALARRLLESARRASSGSGAGEPGSEVEGEEFPV